MTESDTEERSRLLQAFHAEERRELINGTKVGCVLVILLMPAGSLLDAFVYGGTAYAGVVPQFFQARILSSVIGLLILGLLFTQWGKRLSPLWGIVVPMLPAVFIAWMIAKVEGFQSPYYAGLNLVVLAVGALLRWTTLESFIVVMLVLAMYITAGIAHGGRTEPGTLFNNFYFIVLMDIIVVVGTFFQQRLRLREFTLRFELDQKKKELEISNQKLVELDSIKSRFFGNISHELRTPLTLLLAPLETILSRFREQFDAKTHSLLVTMHGNGMRLLKLINDLLDLVRLESGVIQIKREPVNVQEFIHGLTKSAQQVADDKKITLETKIGNEVGCVMLDRDRVEKVLLNLLFNSLKFTPSAGRVTIRAQRQKDELNIQVEDTGIGIPKKQLAHVFDRFWQADGSSRKKYQGVGIGLSLVKELVEAHDGQVAVDSEEGRGTIFTVSLPFLEGSPLPLTSGTGILKGTPESEASAISAPFENEETSTPSTVGNQEWLSDLYRRAELFPAKKAAREEESLAAVSAPAASEGKAKLLIADDEFGMREFIKSQLQDSYAILEAEDGQQAIDKARRDLPEVILLDMMMPEKDGLQVCQEIRESPATSAIPIVLLTARADEEIKLKALAAGASDFLSKPFSTSELQVRIKNLVDSYHYQQQLSQKNQTLESTLKQLKEAESQLVQSEKLASLGRLSAGIIHEINNPLNFATTGLFTLRKLGDQVVAAQREEFQEILKDVEEGLHRVKTIVTDLRSFSHHENDSLDIIPVQEIVTTTLRFLSGGATEKIAIKQEIEDSLCVRVNKNKMVQVLINLMQNALDALRSKEFTTELPFVKIAARQIGERCHLTVADNGPGVEPDALDKIFDPFFTTKDVGAGMGLGLSICYRIVESFSGRITVKSEPGQGCTVDMDFPAADLAEHDLADFQHHKSIA